jgi:hypothetical protein
MAIDPNKRPVAFGARWGLMVLAAVVLIIVVAWAIGVAT